MDGFDPLAMPYLHSPIPFGGGNMQNLDYMGVPPVMDLQDQYSNFDSEPYMSGDELGFPSSTSFQQAQLLKRYSSGFDDPFAEGTMAQFDPVPTSEGMAESPSIDRESKYLSFSMPQYNFTLLDDSFRRSSISISAQLHGMFFLAESQWPATPDTPPPPPELTCYRRNLFQISGSVTLPRNLRYVFTDDGSRIPIYELELAVSATESVEGNPVKIISVPWKTPSGGETAKPEDKMEREPPTIALDKMSGQDVDTDFTTFPIQWKRLQFRIATANNGRRKELQQHFTLHLKIMASLSTGGKISIAEAHSGAVIVRGRSPRNFAARKDLPLSSSSTARKHVSGGSRNAGGQTSVPQVTSAPRIKSPPDEVAQMPTPYENNDLKAAETDPAHWSPVPGAEALSTSNYSGPMNPPLMPSYSHEATPELQTPAPFPFTFPQEMAPSSGPLSLYFGSDDEGGSPYSSQQQPPPPQQPQQPSRHSSRPPTSNPSPSLVNKSRGPPPYASMSPGNACDPAVQRPRLHTHQVSMTSVTSTTAVGPIGSTISVAPMPLRPELVPSKPGLPFGVESERADQLYEYFPLGLDDWMPPVDAVFRPHVVHHSGPLPPDPRSPGRHTSKRYFSEVV